MPIRILLIGAVVFMAAYFAVLKPKEEVIPASAPAATPVVPGGAQSAPGKFADKAKSGAAEAERDAVGAANADVAGDATAPAPSAGATGTRTRPGTATSPKAEPAPPSIPPKALKGLPAPIRTALKERKVVVLGVLDTAAGPLTPMADDDRAVRNVLRDVNRYGNDVVVRTAPLARLATYDGLLKSLQISQSPTIVVVDRDRRATALPGFVDRASINQAIADARRHSTEKRITDPYLRRVNDQCASRNVRYRRFSLATVRGAQGAAADRLVGLTVRDRRAVKRIAAPKRWRSLKAQHVRGLDGNVRSARAVRARLKRDKRLTLIRRGAVSTGVTDLGPALDRRFSAVGLTSCAANRTR